MGGALHQGLSARRKSHIRLLLRRNLRRGKGKVKSDEGGSHKRHRHRKSGKNAPFMPLRRVAYAP